MIEFVSMVQSKVGLQDKKVHSCHHWITKKMGFSVGYKSLLALLPPPPPAILRLQPTLKSVFVATDTHSAKSELA